MARGVPVQHPLHPAGTLQQGGPLRPRQDTQGGEHRPHLLRRHLVPLEGVHIAAQSGQPLQQRPRQGGDKQGQLPLRQRADRLKALQIEGQPPLVQAGHRPQGALSAALEEGGSPRRPPEGLSALQSLPGPLPLPDGQVVVVQQPLRRPRQRGLSAAPKVQRLLSPAHCPQAGPHPPGQGAAGDRPLQPGLSGCVGGVLLQMGVIHGDVGGVGHENTSIRASSFPPPLAEYTKRARRAGKDFDLTNGVKYGRVRNVKFMGFTFREKGGRAP